MIESIFYYDGANESFYHGMMLGLFSIVNNKYRVKSNGESGYGRFDIVLYPENKCMPGFVFEFKKASCEEEMDSLADLALKQIEDNHYDQEMLSCGIFKIIKIGISFCGKKTQIKSM